MTRLHSEASVPSRHPIHGVAEFADEAARDAHVYDAGDIGKVVQTGTGTERQYWLIYDVDAGVAAFREVAAEVDEGEESGTIWVPDAPTLHACSDWFAGATIDPKWPEWDPANLFLWAAMPDRKALQVSSTTVGGGTKHIAARYQPVPASQFAFATKAVNALVENATAIFEVGLVVLGDVVGSPLTADARTLGLMRYAGNKGVRVLAWSDFETLTPDADIALATQNNTLTQSIGLSPYLRMRLNGTALACDYSHDGKNWQALHSETLGFTPAYFGLYSATMGNTGFHPCAGYFDMFSVWSGANTAGFDESYLGRNV